MQDWYVAQNIKLPVEEAETQLKTAVANLANCNEDGISEIRIVKKSIDARKNPKLFFVFQCEFRTHDPLPEPLPKVITRREHSKLDIQRPASLDPLKPREKNKHVLVVGSGPAGLFATLALVEAGVPTIMLERGKPVETRMRDIGQLRSHGTLDPESNVCFGEGGAGTYTDGKLYTRIKHKHVAYVMRRFVDFGANPDILIEAHPHLGTDKLVRLVARMREYIIEKGGDVRFETRMTRLIIERGHARAVELADGSHIEASAVVLALGHSARDTLAQLNEDGLNIEAKPFAVGVRVEHPQSLINQDQFGISERHPLLGSAAYSLTHQVADSHLGQRGVYTFCMCPGGFIVPSPTEQNHMAINGMSNANRSAPYANSGVVVQVTPEDLQRHGYKPSPLIGFAFQRDLEAKTFQSTQQPFAAPAMKIRDFLKRKASGQLAPTNFRPVAEPHDLWQILPKWIAKPLAEGLQAFGNRIHAFKTDQGNMLAVESRTSSPVRIPRDEQLQALDVEHVYPVGEGAGYAGGIVSAAVDGIRAAEAIIAKMR